MRYRAGWFIPQQILALTHFVPDATQDDFTGIFEITNQCLAEAKNPFHLIIDNRIIANPYVATLDQILQMMPQFQASPLRWCIMILPENLPDKVSYLTMQPQQVGDVQLRYVDSLEAAFDALRTVDPTLNWDSQVTDFFVEDVTFNEK